MSGQTITGKPEPSLDFRVLFESAPGLYLVLTPDLKIVAVSNEYLRATMTERRAILGRCLFEVFPHNPDDLTTTGVGNLSASLERVLQNNIPDLMAVQKYDIRRPVAEGGEVEERYWSTVNSPVFGAGGEIAYVIHRVEDVTDFVLLKQRGVEQEKQAQEMRFRSEQREAEIFLRAQELQESNRHLRQANEDLGRLKDGLEQRVQNRTAELAERVRLLRSHGAKPKYFHKIVGYNSRLDEMQAAILRVKLRHLDQWTSGRQANAARYDLLFHGADLGTPRALPHMRHIYNQYVIRTPRRDDLIGALKEAGIGHEVYYPLCLHQQECFANLPSASRSLPQGEAAAREVLALPVYPELTEEQASHVARFVKDFLAARAGSRA